MVWALLALEGLRPNKSFTKKDMPILVVNGVIYALAIFAYAGFDRVLVGLVYSLVVTAIAVSMYWQIRKRYWEYPVTTYTALTYALGTLAAMVVRV